MSVDYIATCRPCAQALIVCSDGFSGPQQQAPAYALMWFVRKHQDHGPVELVQEQTERDDMGWEYMDYPPEEMAYVEPD